MSDEVWLPVVGYEGVYSVSSLGRVRCDVRGGQRRTIQVASSVKSDGLEMVYLRQDDDGQHFHVGLLVLEAFVGPRPIGRATWHKNGDKLDNRLENLEYKLQSEIIKTNGGAGKRKLNESQLKAVIRLHKDGVSSYKLSKMFGCSSSNIRGIIRRQRQSRL